MQYFIDTYGVTGNIVLQGNSRGTMASALVIKALAGQAYNPQNQKKDAGLEETSTLPEGKYDFTIDAYICQNGTFGYSYDEEDWAAIAATGLKVWAFDGEQDSNNVESIAQYTQIMTELKGADWAKRTFVLPVTPLRSMPTGVRATTPPPVSTAGTLMMPLSMAPTWKSWTARSSTIPS